jgi:sugar/nucleoside kinase (ribokinase family)
MRKFLDSDGILINMMSGGDIQLDTLDEIRMAVRGSVTKIHFDYHNLTLGIGERSRRFRRPLPDWRRWAFMVDTVQMNEEEIAGLTTERLTEEQVAGHLLTLSTKGVLVTRGKAGVTAYTSDHKRVVRNTIPVQENVKGITGGRGDLFGAAFLSRYCETGNIIASAEYAAARASSEGPE